MVSVFDLGPLILTMPQIFERLSVKSGRDMADYIPTLRLKHEWRSFFPDDSVIDLYGDLNVMLQENTCLSEKDMEEYGHF